MFCSELVVGAAPAGYELVHEPTNADVILFNTCSVRQHAEDKIYTPWVVSGRTQRHTDTLWRFGLHGPKDQELITARCMSPHLRPGQLGACRS